MVFTSALYAPPGEKPKLLRRLNLLLEQMRVLWRLVEERTWISGRQCLHVNARIDEAGRMVGAWIKSMNRDA